MPVCGLRLIFVIFATSLVLGCFSRFSPQTFKHFYLVHSDSYLEDVEFVQNIFNSLKDNLTEDTLGFIHSPLILQRVENKFITINLFTKSLYSRIVTKLFDLPPP